MTNLRHRDGVLQLDEPRRGCCSVVSTESTMLDSSGRRIFGRVGIARFVREPRQFMTDQANAVYQEIDMVGISGLVHDLQPGLVDLRANSRASP